MKSFTKNSFLLPIPKKLILAAILFFVFGWFVWPIIVESLITDWYPTGFPAVIHAVGLCPPPGDCIDFRWMALIFDAAFWYFISAVVSQVRIRFWVFYAYLVLGILGTLLFGILLLWLHISLF